MADPCALLTGHVRDACYAAQKLADNPQSNQGLLSTIISGGGPGSDWWRHAVFRIIEVVVGVAMIVVGVKAFVSGSPTTKVIVQAGKKVTR